MRRQIIVVFLSLFWLLLAPSWGAERGALFRVTANGHTMHLFGTMHVGAPELYPLEPRIMEAVSRASALALEIDPGQPAHRLVAALREHGTVRGQERAYEGLAPSEHARLEAAVRGAGMDPARAATFRPALLATMLALAEFKKLGLKPELSCDAFLARHARAARVRIVELETVGSQLALLGRLPLADQRRFLMETVGTIETGQQRKEARAMALAWAEADREAFDRMAARIAADDSLSARFVREVLLEGRNVTMADKLARLLASEPRSVAAIGALHLVGEKSVPALLRARGLRVERIY